MYGTHSPLFATDWEDEDAFTERYACQCGELKGRVYEDEICPVCKTKVKFRDVDLRMTGWIRLYNHTIIHPIFYKMIKSIIGDKQFTEIIEFDKEITRDGIVVNKKSKNPFKGIGLIEFKERFEEILDYYRDKKKNKIELIDEVLGEKEKVFSNCIPVYSSVLRPVSFKGETYFFNSIDRKYNSIYSLTRLLNDCDLLELKQKKNKNKKMDEPTTLQSVQKKLMELWELIFMQINQKDGHIKDQILGGRINFSARNVIIQDPDLRADEIRLGYLAFLELYKYEIIAHLAKMNDISENEAYDQWYRATINFNQKIYEIMMYLVKKRKPRVIINRNPTINYGSMLLMKIVDIKADYKDDYTMSLPIQILPVLNADFDGDILNIISLKSKKLIKAYDRTFNPRKNMFISRNDGRFNNDFNLFKDQLIGLYEFNNI
jgi:DNA-directed RNA polymerase beta' subunit